MIDMVKAVKEFKRYIASFKDSDKIGYELKEKHTYGVMEKSRIIAESLNLSSEDVALAELIALLHDIGRFEEMKVMNCFDGNNFNHAEYGVKILFEDGLIDHFTKEKSYYRIIEKAVINHNRLTIEEGLSEEELLHAKIIRDSDKIDNFEIKLKRAPEHLFKNTVNGKSDFENSMISDAVYDAVMQQKCVNLKDRKFALDFYICVLAFVLDLNFKASFEIVRQQDYINKLIDRFDYKLPETKAKMEDIRKVLNGKIETRL